MGLQYWLARSISQEGKESPAKNGPFLGTFSCHFPVPQFLLFGVPMGKKLKPQIHLEKLGEIRGSSIMLIAILAFFTDHLGNSGHCVGYTIWGTGGVGKTS